MSLKQTLLDDLKVAMKARDGDRLATLRMIKSKMQEAEVELRAKKGRDYELDDEQALAVITSYAKQRKESKDAFQKAGRDDLVAKEDLELGFLADYLPKQLGEDEVRSIVREVIADVGADGPSALGQVMKPVMAKLKGAADGKLINQIVREELGS